MMSNRQRGFVSNSNRTSRGFLAEGRGDHLTVTNGLQDARRRRNAALLNVADGLPAPRPHPVFNEIANPKRADERNNDPAKWLMKPLEACIDAAVASKNVALVCATRERIEELFAELQTQLDARFTEELAMQVLDLPSSIKDAYEQQALEQAESDVAESRVMLDPTDVTALERAEVEGRQNVRALQRWVGWCANARTRAAQMVQSAHVAGGTRRWT